MLTIDPRRPDLHQDPFFRLAVRTVEYLMRCQVVAEDARVSMSPAPTSDEPDRATGELVTRELAGDAGLHRYRLVTRRDRATGARQLWIEPLDDAASDSSVAPRPSRPVANGPFAAGDYFRLFRGQDINRTVEIFTPEPEPAYTRRLVIKYAKLLGTQLARSRPREAPRILEGLGGLARYYLTRSVRLPHAHRLENVTGITWRVESVTDDTVHLHAYDRGGIFDFHTNSEGAPMPPQVMGTVYADAYSAWAFAFLHLAGNDGAGVAARLALEFLERVYDQYAVSMTPMTHADFKNAGLLETLDLYQDHLTEPLRGNLHRRASALREDQYLPTNVFALRHHWRTAQAVAGFTAVTDDELSRIHRRVARDLLPEGLIQDNNPGRFYFDSHDLTYHQYTLACLADSLRHRRSPAVERTLLRGLDFSLGCLTPDGEISYMGRGANNIYHLSSAASAFLFGARLVVGSDDGRGARYRRAAELILPYLATAQREDGMLATAINPEIDLLMAWNHCHTPYNALTSYHLLRAATDHGAPDLPPVTPDTTIPLEEPGRCDHHPGSGFVMAATPDYYVTFFGGCERSYSWTGVPHHFTGAPGLAMLGVPGEGALIPILDGPTTDYPFSGDDPTGRGEIVILRRNPSIIQFTREHRRAYVLLDRCLVVLTRGRELRWMLRAPTRRDGPWTASISDGDGGQALPRVECAGGPTGIVWQAVSVNREWTPESRKTELSNPRGFVDVWEAGRIHEGEGNGDVVTAFLVLPGSVSEPEVRVKRDRDELELRVDGHLIRETPAGVRLESA